MEVDTKVYLGKKFKEHYLKSSVTAPLRVEQREFGFGTLEEKIKFRHKSFKSDRELQHYLQRETPFYISYSAAYYEFPENKSMKEKVWSGADLVFDLDAEMPLLDEKVLEDVKKQTANLLEFLEGDFNFDQSKISINYSGSKGYHIHCRDEKVMKLGGEERREIVDYVTATGLELKHFLHDEEARAGIVFRGERGPKVQSTMLRGPSKNSSGWGRRMYEAVREEVEKTVKLDENRKTKLLKSLDEGIWSGVEGFREKSFRKIIEKYAVKLTGDTDKMVTLDTSRLIRLPDSLHGGTGLKAARVKNIEDFNPQVDAIAFGEGEVNAKISKEVNVFKLKDKKYGPYDEGEKVRIPEYAAIYLMLKDKAEYVK